MYRFVECFWLTVTVELKESQQRPTFHGELLRNYPTVPSYSHVSLNYEIKLENLFSSFNL